LTLARLTVLLALSLWLGCATASSHPRDFGDPRGATSCAGLPTTDSTVYDTTQVSERPRARSGPILQYPVVERQRGIKGRVIVAMIIRSDGTVDQHSVRVLQRVDPALDDEALRWVKFATYWPGCRDGEPVNVHVSVPIDFKLRG
jgi:TonB family protein